MNLREESEGYINSQKDAAEATGQLVVYWLTVQKIWYIHVKKKSCKKY
jgi:hypothetical protein